MSDAPELEAVLVRLQQAEINAWVGTAPTAHIAAGIHDPNGGPDIRRDFHARAEWRVAAGRHRGLVARGGGAALSRPLAMTAPPPRAADVARLRIFCQALAAASARRPAGWWMSVTEIGRQLGLEYEAAAVELVE